MSTKFKVAALILLIVSNIAVLVGFRMRRAEPLPDSVRQYVPLAEISKEEREKRVASLFTLDSFQIVPLAAESKFVVIPRPQVKWQEQMVHSTNYVNSESSDKDSSKDTDAKKDRDSSLPWKAGATKLNMISIALSVHEMESTPEPDQILVREKTISRDAYMAKNGIAVPVMQLIAVERYYVDKTENTLVQTEKAVVLNGEAQAVLSADVPQWLLPKRKLAIGETWVQVGGLPNRVADTAPRPEVARTLNRLVMFEGRRAAEIQTKSTFYEYSFGTEPAPVKHKEEGITYVDLETGEPLWFEGKSKDDRQFTSLTRGCNQIFSKHLIRIPNQ